MSCAGKSWNIKGESAAGFLEKMPGKFKDERNRRFTILLKQ